MGLRFAAGSRDLLKTLAPAPKQRIRDALRRLGDDPRDSRLDLKRLDVDAQESVFRCRVQDYRIVYAVRSDHTYVLRIMHRREGYGWLERL